MTRAGAMRLAAFLLLAILAGAGLPGGISRAKPYYFIDEAKLPFAPLPGATAYWGVNDKAGYRMEVPASWNGSLVLYAHGYAGAGAELRVQMPSLRGHLIASGFAWAASSYRENGYVPGIGAKDTHALGELFSERIGEPDRVYITGHSMGGHITGVAIEQWPNAYVGALPMCGVMGDNELFDYFQDVYLVAETLVHGTAAVPMPSDYATVGRPATIAALGGVAPGFPFTLSPLGEKLKAAIEQLTGGDRPTFDQSWRLQNGGGFAMTVAGTGDGRENLDTVYQFDADPALTAEEQAFNDLIVRVAAEPQYRHPNGLGGMPGSTAVSPPISGKISIPVLSIHTIGELFVPFHMEQIYARRVAEQGRSGLLVSRAIRDGIHCNFTTQEQINAFNDLVNWVENGVKPGGDDILDPASVASPAFGCTYTVGFSALRATMPPCP